MRQTFFGSGKVIILAHRGLARTVPENSLAAFRAALDAGADVLECDVRSSSDGVAVFAHDETLLRVYGDPRAVASVPYRELRRLRFDEGESVVSVEDALIALPQAKFNVDIKSDDVVKPFASAVLRQNAVSRVLVASFSQARRQKTRDLLAGVATSESGPGVLIASVMCWIGVPWLARALVRGNRILQIPTRVLWMNVSSRRMLRRFHRGGFTVQFWTINDADEMRELLLRGADGIVTDECDIAVKIRR